LAHLIGSGSKKQDPGRLLTQILLHLPAERFWPHLPASSHPFF